MICVITEIVGFTRSLGTKYMLIASFVLYFDLNVQHIVLVHMAISITALYKLHQLHYA